MKHWIDRMVGVVVAARPAVGRCASSASECSAVVARDPGHASSLRLPSAAQSVSRGARRFLAAALVCLAFFGGPSPLVCHAGTQQSSSDATKDAARVLFDQAKALAREGGDANLRKAIGLLDSSLTLRPDPEVEKLRDGLRILVGEPAPADRGESKPSAGAGPSWATVVARDPDPAVVTDAAARARMAATGLPWKVRDNKTGIVMLLCPPGEFTMGSPASEAGRDDDEVQHRRAIRRAFYLSETEVTQEAWEKLMGGNPSYFKGAANPVEMVSWNDCVRFCETAGLRLPTEAEWEYACRAGTTGAYAGDLASMGWFADNSGRKPLDAEALKRDRDNYVNTILDNGCQSRPVRQRKPNAWGLYDMHGNVWEWVGDHYADYPTQGGTEEAARTAEGGAPFLRGGGWNNIASHCRFAPRYFLAPGATNFLIGFRVARTPD
jgi:formylglycine-generating enzyme required for sulfatase activity